MFHPLTLVPIYQTARHHITSHHITSHHITSHHIPRYCKLYTAGCKINERQTTASSYSDKKDQTSEA